MKKNTLNRQAIVLTGRDPLLEWARAGGLELADGFHKVFLVDFDDAYTEDQAPALIEAHAATIFEQTLDELLRNRAGWPELSVKNFRSWFDAHVSCFIIDLSSEPLEIL